MSLACEIQPTGNFGIDSLRFKSLDFYNAEGERIGWLCLGGPKGDVLFIDGIEVSIVQLGDPPQLRLATRDPNGLQMGGVVQGCALRMGEDVHENLAQLQIGGKQEDVPPGTYQGSIVAKVRTNQGPDEDGQQTALALTAAYADDGKLWGGLPNFPGGLGKYANATDGPQYVCPGHGGTPAPGPTQPIDTLWAPDGLTFCQLQGDTNLVIYKTPTPFEKVPESVVFDTTNVNDQLAAHAATLDEYDRRLDKLERRGHR